MSPEAALALTLGLEVPAAVLAARWLAPAAAWRRVLLTAVGASLLTHPFAWWANRILPWAFAPRATAIELTVVAAEAAIFTLLVPVRPAVGLTLSALANGLSFGFGLVWFYWLRGWLGG